MASVTEHAAPPFARTDTLSLKFSVRRDAFAMTVDLNLPARGITALFGHSGSGKTTCLRILAGLERAADTQIRLGDQVWQDDAQGIFLPTHRRPLGYVFQEASLFPHLTVGRNLDFGQRRAQPHLNRPARQAAVGKAAALLGIDHLLDRHPDSLSGGERQRAAIARALLTAPRILLMDEPLAALDLKRKQEILPYLERLHQETAIPIIYVSHAPDEVARLADHLVLLEQGRVVASGPLSETLGRVDLPPAFADDAGVVIPATIAEHEADGLSRLEFTGGRLYVSRCQGEPGTRVRCRIHARDVSLVLAPPQGTTVLNVVPVQVTAIAPTDTPGHVLVALEASGCQLMARITERSRQQLGISPGLALWAQVKAVALLA